MVCCDEIIVEKKPSTEFLSVTIRGGIGFRSYDLNELQAIVEEV